MTSRVYNREYAGMRMGEINAVKVEDVDFANDVIHVRRTISKGLDDRSHVRESTNTVKGMRDVPINDLVRPVLEDAIRNAPYNRLGLIFYAEVQTRRSGALIRKCAS